MITVVGLGPAGPELTTPAARQVLDDALAAGLPVSLRTARHPAAEPYAGRPGVESFDGLYDEADTFEDVYERIVDALVEAAAALGSAVYAVPGSPLVAERTVALLRTRAAAATDGGSAAPVVEVLPGLSFADLAWVRLGIDPVAEGVRLVDGPAFALQAAGDRGPWLVGQCWSRQVLSDIKLSVGGGVDGGVADERVTLLHHLGLPDEQVVTVAWSEIDRTLEADHLTSLYVPASVRAPMHELAVFMQTVERLRQDCPWDREQTHTSLVRHLLEETYEAIEALEGLGDQPADASAEQAGHAEEELGDLLCQVAFHSVLGAEEGLFTLADIARSVNDKLVVRHPHVFGDVVADSAAAVVSNWERIKHREKGRTHLFEGVPQAMPALARAAKVERKLESVGYGWGATGIGPDEPAPVEAGDALLALARAFAAGGVDPEAALRGALERLGASVALLEARARDELDLDLADVDPAVRLEWWHELHG